MAFYQNVFDEDFRGNWILDDRNLALTFKCPGNKNKTDVQVCWNFEPYDLSTFNTLTLYYVFDRFDMAPSGGGLNSGTGIPARQFMNWSPLAINIAGASPAATKASEIVTILNANAGFSDRFTATLDNFQRGTNQPTQRVIIKTNKPKSTIKFFVDNGGAEQKLKFNKFAGVADLPLYFDRHTLANRWTYPDGLALLQRLSKSITAITVANPTHVTITGHGLTSGDVVYIVGSNSTPTIDGQRTVTVLDANTFTVPVNVTTAGTRGEMLTTVNYNVVTDFGLDYTTMKQDWQMLFGGTDTFLFTNTVLDSNGYPTQIIQYHAGSVAGDLAIKTINVYDGTAGHSTPTKTFQVPYQLQAADLITPP